MTIVRNKPRIKRPEAEKRFKTANELLPEAQAKSDVLRSARGLDSLSKLENETATMYLERLAVDSGYSAETFRHFLNAPVQGHQPFAARPPEPRQGVRQPPSPLAARPSRPIQSAKGAAVTFEQRKPDSVASPLERVAARIKAKNERRTP